MSAQKNLWYKYLSPKRINTSKETEDSLEISAYRNAFDIDFDRIVFSRAFRNLQEKTQVHSTTTSNISHNRLTHSIEVACVGRSLGRKVGQQLIKQDIGGKGIEQELLPYLFGNVVAAASLTHDIGNPPFGHYGESIISSFFKDKVENTTLKNDLNEVEKNDLLNYEGNAQGFRLLTRAKDLSLTYSTLATFTKYPCKSTDVDSNNKRKSRHKYGYFYTEKDIFEDVAKHSSLPKISDNSYARHPLAFLVEAADDICYNIIDLEDAYHLGILTFDETIDLLAPIIGNKYNKNKLDKIHFDYDKIGVIRAMSVGALVSEVAYTFLDYSNDILNGDFDRDLIKLCTFSDSIDIIKTISKEKIYQGKEIIKQEKKIKDIFYNILESLYNELVLKNRYDNQSKVIKQVLKWINHDNFKNNVSQYEKIRAMLDYVCTLTERQCLDFYNNYLK